MNTRDAANSPPVPDAEFLLAFLRGRDVACPGCGYNLRDQQRDRCPECGQEIVLRLGLADSRQGAAIAGLIGLAAGAGLSGLLLLYGCIRVCVMGDHYFGLGSFFAMTSAGTIVEGVALLAWLRSWRRIRLLGAGTKTLLVMGSWTLTAVNLVAFAIVVR